MVSMGILLPDIKTQEDISSVLSSYDDLIENNEKRIKILEEMAERLYREWFVYFRFPGHEKVRFVDSGTEFGNIPEGWEVKKLGDVLENIKTPSHPGDHLHDRVYVPIENISKKNFVLAESTDWREAQSSLVLFNKDDILFGAMRPYFHKVAIAPCPGVTRTTCLVLRPKNAYERCFGLMVVFSDQFVSFASSNTQGATIPYAVWGNSLENFSILYPDRKTLEIFEEKVGGIIAILNVMVGQNITLKQTRDLLIPQLVTGKRELK
jgi:type I restriction enzyme S subunit